MATEVPYFTQRLLVKGFLAKDCIQNKIIPNEVNRTSLNIVILRHLKTLNRTSFIYSAGFELVSFVFLIFVSSLSFFSNFIPSSLFKFVNLRFFCRASRSTSKRELKKFKVRHFLPLPLLIWLIQTQPTAYLIAPFKVYPCPPT